MTTALQVRFGLAPLKRISASLAAIRSGRAERLEGEFPVEIAPLARETNALIDANREIVERARTHVGNLAHALKTPLSVIVNEATTRGNDPLAHKVLEQTDIMRDQVARQLERARLAARSTVVGTLIDVPPVVTALARTMEKLHRDARHRHRRRRAATHAQVPRRAAGPRRDGRQSRRQRLQVGAVARRHRGGGRASQRRRQEPMAMAAQVARAHHRRRRRAGAVAGRARAGGDARRSGSTRPSPAPVSGLSIVVELAGFTAACSRSAPRRSAVCAPNWRCRGVDPFSLPRQHAAQTKLIREGVHEFVSPPFAGRRRLDILAGAVGAPFVARAQTRSGPTNTPTICPTRIR